MLPVPLVKRKQRAAQRQSARTHAPAAAPLRGSPFPAWFGDNRDDVDGRLWCAFHAGERGGRGAYLLRREAFTEHGAREPAARRRCCACSNLVVGVHASSATPTLEQCHAVSEYLTREHRQAWTRLGYDGSAAAAQFAEACDDSHRLQRLRADLLLIAESVRWDAINLSKSTYGQWTRGLGRAPDVPAIALAYAQLLRALKPDLVAALDVHYLGGPGAIERLVDEAERLVDSSAGDAAAEGRLRGAIDTLRLGWGVGATSRSGAKRTASERAAVQRAHTAEMEQLMGAAKFAKRGVHSSVGAAFREQKADANGLPNTRRGRPGDYMPLDAKAATAALQIAEQKAATMALQTAEHGAAHTAPAPLIMSSGAAPYRTAAHITPPPSAFCSCAVFGLCVAVGLPPRELGIADTGLMLQSGATLRELTQTLQSAAVQKAPAGALQLRKTKVRGLEMVRQREGVYVMQGFRVQGDREMPHYMAYNAGTRVFYAVPEAVLLSEDDVSAPLSELEVKLRVEYKVMAGKDGRVRQLWVKVGHVGSRGLPMEWGAA